MAVIAVLNTLVQADTSQFEGKMTRAESAPGKLASKVKDASKDMKQSMGNVGGSGIGGAISSLIGSVGVRLPGMVGQIGAFAGSVRGVFSSVSVSAAGAASQVSGLGSAVSNAGGQAAGAGSRFNSLGSAVANAGGQSAGTSSMFNMMAIGLGAAATAAVVAVAAVIGVGVGLGVMASRGAESISTLRALAQQTGMTTEAMAALSSLGGSGGPEGFARAMSTMQKNIANSSEETNRALARIRLDPAQLRGQGAEQQLRIVASAFTGLADHADRTSVAMALFGDAGVGMIETLSRGGAGLDALAERSRRFGLTFTEAQGTAIKNANREWANFGLAIEGISRQAAILFAPMWEAIGKVGGDIGEFLVSAFRDAIPFIQAFAGNVSQTFAPLWTAIKNIASTLAQMWTSSLPALARLGDLAVAFGKMLLAPIEGFVGQFGGIGMSFAEVFQVGMTWVTIFAETLTAVFSATADGLRELGSFMYTLMVAPWIDAIKSFFGETATGWDDFQTVALTALATIKVSMENLGVAGDLLVNGMKLGWLIWQKAAIAAFQSVVNFFTQSVINPILDGIKSLLDGMRSLLALDPTGILDPGGILSGQLAMVDAALSAIGRPVAINFDTSGLDRDIEDLANSIVTPLEDFEGRINDQVRQWRQSLNAELRRPARVIEEATRTAPVERTTTGRDRAITGTEATLSTSERAFSLIYNNRANETVYQQQTAQATRDMARYMERLVRTEERSPRMRRADL